MEPRTRKPSFDIADHTARARAPSPAPTYHSTLDSHHTSNTTFTNPWWSNPRNYDFPTEKSIPMHDLSPQSKQNHHSADFHPVPEPFDTNHPLYAPPASSPPYIPPPPTLHTPTPRRRLRHYHPSLPPLRILIPWLLALLFFLTTAWFTSLAVGARFLHQLAPPPASINVVVNGHGFAGSAVVSIGPTLTPTPTQPPTPQKPKGGEDNSGNNTLVTRLPPAKPLEGMAPAETTLVTVVGRRG
ncbi:hypothetical protein BDV95DRAFT_360760 [Massariosphaeria phaeospora]|uniref:Uncharacterized protein n=1 Tax=Massariosphaeria phaeospora TaxID=100035 RepID=A0A7C8IBF9_9PLEO|nr:hypothetical protein BDV95DRAFT_360760 [Massariosphaeria phaeospora]